MKILKKTTMVPEQIVGAHEEETTVYGCDCCEFENEDENEVEKHYALTHAVKEMKEVDGFKFVRFETKEGMDAWAGAQCGGYGEYEGWHGSSSYSRTWCGPGWYRISGNREPCGRGCCTRHIMALTPMVEVVSDLEEDIRTKIRRLEDFRREFNLPEPEADNERISG